MQSLLTDTGVFPLELYDRINQVFAKETDPAVKRNAVRDIYLDYGLQKSSDGTRGIMPGKDVADFFRGRGLCAAFVGCDYPCDRFSDAEQRVYPIP